ncbi:MAG: hypothetical protein ACOC4M_14130 [Promethearchaeia archaeon]
MSDGKVIKLVRKVDSPGKCVSCGKPFSDTISDSYPKVGYRFLIQSDGITEPYDFCNKCSNKAERQRVIEI